MTDTASVTPERLRALNPGRNPGGSENKAFWDAYARSDQDLRIRHAKVGCVLALILMPAGATLDYVVYPEHLSSILVIRLLCDLFILPLLVLLYRDIGRRWIHAIGAMWPLLPAVSISWMIALTEGAASPYYAGLNLVIIIACTLMPYTLKDAVVICSLTILLFLAACLKHAHDEGLASLRFADVYGNLYFILLTGIITAAACHYFSRRRVEDFRLRHELAARNREVNASYAKLAELDRQRSQFFANVSHELRTPLTLILAPVEDLLAKGGLEPAAREALTIAKHNAQRLLRLINDLLEIVRIDSGTKAIALEAVELGAFAKAVVESVRYLAEAKGLHLEVEVPESAVPIKADSSRLEKILLNLLSNAIKFTPRDGRINVATRVVDGKAQVSVSDTGEGIPESALPRIFDRFHQVDGSSTRKYQGAGIGLALVRDLVQEHGGEITVRSTKGTGTTFTVTLPLADFDASTVTSGTGERDALARIYATAERDGSVATDTSALDEERQAQGPEGGHTILVVDDEPDMRHYLVSQLAETFRVHQCADGHRAIVMAKALKPDLILLDLMLPGIDGLGICRTLREDDRLADTRIILLTARMDEQTKLDALAGGADDFLTKPFSTPEVVTRVNTQLRTLDLQLGLRHRGDELQQTLTRLQDTEAQLVHSEKMNALGVLSAGILHEVNNPLNFSMNALKVAKQILPPDADQEPIDDALQGLERIRLIAKDLGAFAHKHSGKTHDLIDVQGVVDLARRLCAHELSQVEVQVDIPADLRIRGSQTQLSQVLVNLLINGARATREAGRLGQIRISAASEDHHVRLRVRDNGVGIPPERVKQIFDPFYTTQGVGAGLGLGLSICHTIVSDHGGVISVSSDPGKSTEFTIELPSAALTEAM